MPIIEIYRVRIDPGDITRALEVRAASMAAFRAALPELRQADLVRLHDVWLDIRTWMTAVDPAIEREAARCLAEWDALTAPVAHDRGERVHTTGTAWAAGR